MHRTVDILEGNTFVVSDERGDIDGSPTEAHGPTEVHGLFDRDTRHLSRWVLTLDEQRLTTLSVGRTRYNCAQFLLAQDRPTSSADATVTVIRSRTVFDGFIETVRVTNHDTATIRLNLTLEAAADFADILEIKDDAAGSKRGLSYRHGLADRLILGYERDGYRRETWIRATGNPTYDGGLRFALTLAPQESWDTEIEVLVARSADETPALQENSVWHTPEHRLGPRLRRRSEPVLTSSWHPLELIYRHTIRDLAALRFDLPGGPGRSLPAAGLPWYMTAVGRDSVVTSFQTLPFMPDLAESTLVTLAQLQATEADDVRDAEPGKMLGELRFGELTVFGERPHSPYYGSADVTPLWLILLDEYQRWTGRDDVVRALERPARAALRWIDDSGDRDDDGYLEYERRNPVTGLDNHCWRDSPDAVQWADGRIADLPRATADLQGYAYDAKRRAARLAREVWDDPQLADQLEEQAAHLKIHFNRDFWLPDRGYYALALDGHKQPVDSLTSVLGHLLWSGIVDDERVEEVVSHLTGDRLNSGWGIRTFARGQAGYNPIGYHLGTVWPHDTAFAVLGLARHGYRNQAAELAMGLLDAARLFGHRLPDTFAGFGRDETSLPARHPSACGRRAWAAGTPLLLIRSLLGLEPYGSVLHSSPHLPDRIRRLQLLRVPGRWGTTDVGVDLTGRIRVILPAGAPSSPVVQELIDAARQVFPRATLGERASIGFDLGEAGRLRLVGNHGHISLDTHANTSDCLLTTDAATLIELLRGRRNLPTTLLSGHARLRGDVDLAARLLRLLSRSGSLTR